MSTLLARLRATRLETRQFRSLDKAIAKASGTLREELLTIRANSQ